MDKRNYDQSYDCECGRCECSEDDKCGCTYPNNVENIKCVDDKNCPISKEKKNQETSKCKK